MIYFICIILILGYFEIITPFNVIEPIPFICNSTQNIFSDACNLLFNIDLLHSLSYVICTNKYIDEPNTCEREQRRS